jgi:hypothetical protein
VQVDGVPAEYGAHLLANVAVAGEPFAHLLSPDFAPPAVADALLDWMRGQSDWRARIGEFYDYSDRYAAGAEFPPAIQPLFSAPVVTLLQRRLERAFHTRIGGLTTIIFGKYVAGQGAGLHNDFDDDDESHRIILHLGASSAAGAGGELVLFESRDERDIARVITPRHNRAFAFAISEKSYHAVAEVTGGERFTLAYSFSTPRRAQGA